MSYTDDLAYQSPLTRQDQHHSKMLRVPTYSCIAKLKRVQRINFLNQQTKIFAFWDDYVVNKLDGELEQKGVLSTPQEQMCDKYHNIYKILIQSRSIKCVYCCSSTPITFQQSAVRELSVSEENQIVR